MGDITQLCVVAHAGFFVKGSYCEENWIGCFFSEGVTAKKMLTLLIFFYYCKLIFLEVDVSEVFVLKVPNWYVNCIII